MNRAKPNVFIFEPLERRLLLSGDALPVAAATGAVQLAEDQVSAALSDSAEYRTDFNTVAQGAVPAISLQDGTATGQLELPATPSADAVIEQPATSLADQPVQADATIESLIFINDNIADAEALSASLSSTGDSMSAQRIITLDSATDGISQITATLHEYENINGVYIFSHGATGTVQLGSTWLNNDNLAAYQDAISTWAASLSEQADILLYGCNLAESAGGRQLIESLSRLTASDVAASDNPTGHQALGGDWLLEYHSGTIEASLLLSPAGQQDWLHLLVEQTISDDFASGTYAGSTGSAAWAGDWSEIGETTNPAAGNVVIASGELRITTTDNKETLRGISRTADLSAATAAYLSFDYSTVPLFDYMGEVQLQIKSGASWTTLKTYTFYHFYSGKEFIDISEYISAATEIRFVSEGKIVSSKETTCKSLGIDYFFIDNIKLEYSTNSFENLLWLTTDGNISNGGFPGLGTWSKGDLIQLGNPNLVLEDGVNTANFTTDGTFTMAANISSLISDKNISAFHYVSSDLLIGASDFQLYAGDLLLSSRDASDFNGLLVTNRDVVVYHPDNPGDYSAGTFTMLMKNLSTKEIRAMTLVEQDTMVGDTNLMAGEFLFVEDLDTKNVIKVFHTIDVGATSTSGTVTTLVDGNAPNVNLNEIFGIDLVEQSVTLGGRTFNSGEILLSSSSDAIVGNNNLAVKEEDIFVISIAAGSGNATASLVFEGADIGFSGNSNRIDGFSLITKSNSPANNAPTIESIIPTQNLDEDFASYTIELNAAFADVETIDANLSFSVSGNSNINVGIAGGIATISAPANWHGTETLQFTATDEGTPRKNISQDVVFTVNPVNDTPTVESIIPAQNLAEDFVSYAIDLHAAFADVETIDSLLSYSVSGNSNINVSLAGGIATISSSANWYGSETITFTATDAGTPGLSANQDVVFTVNPVNDVPTIESTIPAQNLAEDFASYTIDLNAAFADIETIDSLLSYSVSGNSNINVSLAGGIATISSTANWHGSETITFTATDAGSPGLAASQDVVFTVNPVNDAPTVESIIPAQNLAEDFASYTIDLNAAFADVETIDSLLSYSVTGNSNINVSLAGGIATISSSANWNGSETVTFTATDAGMPGLAVSQAVLFSVSAVNDTPTVESTIPAQNLAEDFASYTIDLHAAFADVETIDSLLSYSVSGNTNINVSIAGGIATISSRANWNGSETVTFTATDAGTPGLTASQAVLFSVSAVNDTPTVESTIPAQNLAEDFASYTIDLHAAFADVETIDSLLSYSVSGNTNINVSIAGGIATISSTANWNGSETVTFTATDAGTPGLAASQAVLFSVSAVNDAPTVMNLNAAETYTEDTPRNLTDIVISDIDNATVTATLTLSDVGAGTLSTATSGLVTSTFAIGVWTASGALADVNSLLAGVVFNPAANYNAPVNILTIVDDGIAPPLTGNLNIMGIPVADTPRITSITTDQATQSGLIFITPNLNDGSEVTHFRISGITNGALFLADGITTVHTGDFITLEQGAAGLRFTPNSAQNGTISVESSEDGATIAAQSNTVMAVVTVTSLPALSTDSTPDVPDIPLQVNPPALTPLNLEVPGAQDTTDNDDMDERTTSDSEEQENSSQPIVNSQPSSAADFKFDLILKQAAVSTLSLQDLNQMEQALRSVENEVIRHDLKSEMNEVLNLIYQQRSLLETQMLKNSLDSLRDETAREARFEKTIIGTAIAATTSLSAGYVIWLIRSGVLLSSLLSSMPAWQLTDPMAILTSRNRNDEDDTDDSLESIIESGGQKAKKPSADSPIE